MGMMLDTRTGMGTNIDITKRGASMVIMLIPLPRILAPRTPARSLHLISTLSLVPLPPLIHSLVSWLRLLPSRRCIFPIRNITPRPHHTHRTPAYRVKILKAHSVKDHTAA